MTAEDLLGLFNRIHSKEYDSEIDFKKGVLPEFFEILGYDQSNIYQEITLPSKLTSGGTITPDSVVAKRTDKRPWLIAETILHETSGDSIGNSYHIANRGNELIATGAEYVVVLTPYQITVDMSTAESDHPARAEGTRYSLDKITLESCSEIISTLEPPVSLPDVDLIDSYDETEEIDTTEYKLDIEQFQNGLSAADNVSDPNKKGDTFEEVCRILMDGFEHLDLRDKNLPIREGEIDLVYEYTGHNDNNLFETYGRFIFVECKNEEDPTSTTQIDNVINKMRRSGVKLGIIFARNDVSGSSEDEYSKYALHDEFVPGEFAIVVINGADLKRIMGGESLYEIIDKKLYKQRFGSEGSGPS